MTYQEYLKNAKTVKESQHFTLYNICYSPTALAKNIDNTPVQSVINNAKLVIEHILEPLTEHFKIIPDIHCMYRCALLNKEVGGVPDSQHLSGQAVDLTIVGISLEQIVDYIRHNVVFDQLIYENGWVHCSFSNIHNRKEVLKNINGKFIVI